ncbi:hypothetical protein ACI65C_008987 [Semiaphis heraclei]
MQHITCFLHWYSSWLIKKKKMNNNVSEEAHKEQPPKISIEELDGSVIELPLSTFNNILEKEITKFILKREPDEKDIIDLKELVNVQRWRIKYKDLEQQAEMLNSVLERLKRELKQDKCAQPLRCMAGSISQYVNISTKIPMANAHMNSNNEHPTFTISDSDDDDVIIINETSKTQTENEIIIDLIDSDEDTQNLSVKYKPGPKSKTNVSIPDLKLNDNDKILPINTEASKSLNNGECLSTTIREQKPWPKSKTNVSIPDLKLNDNDKVLPINIEASKSLNNGECLSTTIREQKPGPKSKTNVSIPDLKINNNDTVLPINTEASKSLSNGECLSTTIRKRKPGPKSKTMYVDDIDLETTETVEKKMRLNECDVINNTESNTTNVLDFNSVKKLEAPEKYNHNFILKSSSLKYPPPYPSIPPHNNQPSWKNVPPIPNMTIKTLGNTVTLTWNLNLTWQTAKIKMYELFVCQETDASPKSSMWKKKGSIKAKLLPMACELEVLELGYIYHFALRAVDVHNRRAPFAIGKTKV